MVAFLGENLELEESISVHPVADTTVPTRWRLLLLAGALGES